MALIAALLAASLSADPHSLVLGKDKGAELTLDAPADARVTFSSNVGTVGAARREGDVFRAHFTPPQARVPQVALILAQIERDGGRELSWLSIPLAGADTMEIETRPGASVTAEVGGRKVGPVTADARGIARLPMVVSPGVSTATLHISDKLGNAGDKPLDVTPPPYARMRMAVRETSPLEVEVFVVKPDGSPDDSANVELTASAGKAQLQARVAPGVYLATFQPPAGMTSGNVRLEARAGGQHATLEAPVTASRAGRAQEPWWSSRSSTQRPWAISVGPLGGVGSSFDGATEGTAMLEGAVRLGALPVEAVVDAGWSFFKETDQFRNNAANAERARVQARYLQLGARYATQLTGALAGHATVLAGAQSQVVGRTLPTGAAVAQDAWVPRFALALGVNLNLGPGRALAQVQFDGSPSGKAGLIGSPSGVQAMVGYLFTVR